MKLSICLMLAVVAAASADQGFYQPQPVAQSAPSGYNNYYEAQYQPAKKQSWFSQISQMFSGNRRQGDILGGVGIFGLLGPILALIAFGIGLASLGYILTELDNSGDDRDNDEWEVDHSVWMNQLQKDFENSWSVQ